MPEAMLRLGELKWELEREQFVDRFKAWEAKPVDQRGPVPEPNFRRRATSSRACSRTTRGSSSTTSRSTSTASSPTSRASRTRRSSASTASSRSIRNSRFVPDAHMAQGRGASSTEIRLRRRARRVREGPPVQGQTSSTASRSSRARGATGGSGGNDEAAKRFVGVFEVTDSGGRKKVNAVAAKAARRAPGARRCKYLVEVFTEDEKNTAQDVYDFLTKIGGDASPARSCARSRSSSTTRRTTSAASRRTSCSSSSSRRAATPASGCSQIAAGYNALEDWPKLRGTYERAVARLHAGRPVGADAGRSGERRGDPTEIEKAAHARTRSRSTRRRRRTRRAARSSKARRASTPSTSRSSTTRTERLPGRSTTSRRSTSTASTSRRRGHALHGRGARIPAEPSRPRRRSARHPPRRDLQRDRRARARALRGARGAEEAQGAARDGGRQEVRRGARPLRAALSERSRAAGALLPPGPAVLRLRRLRLRGEDLGLAPREVPAQPARARRRRAHPRLVQPREELREHRDVGAAPQGAPSVRAAKQQKRLDTLIVQAVFKQGEQKAPAGDHPGAAAAYLRAAKEFPKDPRAAQACVNAELGGEGRRREDAEGSGAARHRQGLPRQAGVAAGRVDRRDDVPGDGPLRRRGGLPRGDARASPTRSTRTTRSSSTRRTRRTTRSSSASPPASTTRRSRRQQLPRGLRLGERGRRGRLPDGQGAPERGPRQGGRGSLQALRGAREEPGPSRPGLVLLAQAHVKNGEEKAADDALAQAVDIGKHREARARSRRQVRRGARALHAGRARPREVRGDPDLGRREAALAAPQAEGRALEAGVERVPRRRLARRRRVDDRGALPDRPHVRDVRQGAPRIAAAVGARRRGTRRPSTRRRSTSSSSRSRSGASTPTRTAGRRRSSSGSTTSGPRRCATRSAA